MTPTTSRTRSLRIFPALCWVSLLACDAPGQNDSYREDVAEYVLEDPRTIITAEGGLLSRPREIAVDSVGRLYVLDRILNQVIVVSPEGEVVGTIGRPGGGPAEFTTPLFIAARNDGVHVFDFGQNQTKVFSPEGAYLRQYGTTTFGVPSHMSFGPSGRIAYAGFGVPRHGGVVAIRDTTSQQQSVMGALLREELVPPTDLLEVVHQRELPAFMRNSALPVFSSDGALWIFRQTEGVLQKFASDGSLLARTDLAVPEIDAIEDDFFDWYGEVRASDLLRFFNLVEAGTVLDGALWLLWNTPRDRPGLLTVHDDQGEITQRLVFSGFEGIEWSDRPPRRRFAVDRDRRRLYLMNQSALTISWIPLPEGLLP